MIVAWDLSRSAQTVEGLRSYLRDYAVEAFSEVPGMALKVWFSNAKRQIWGGVYLWESAELMPLTKPAAPSRSTELIGYEPTSVSVFEVEAVSAQGDAWRAFADIGLAMHDADGEDERS
ncbi:YdhR family protein [Halostreptopolyspora alba]